jgi:endonuclease G, mitochondrial
MGEHRLDWIANEGVRISRITKHVKAQQLEPEAARLRAQMFEAPPPVEASERESSRARATARPAGSNQADVVVTIPLQVTVRLGAPE